VSDLVESVEVGMDKVKVNMLKYADDTLFFCKASSKSVFSLKAILNCFELASGLKVSFLEVWGLMLIRSCASQKCLIVM